MCLYLLKQPNDLGIYAFINATSILIGQAIMIPQAVKAVRPIKLQKKMLGNI